MKFRHGTTPGLDSRLRAGSILSPVQVAHGVVVHVGVHHLPAEKRPVQCWTFVTNGLKKFGQAEILIAVDRVAGEVPPGPAMLLDAVARRAAAGQLVGVGGFTEFGPAVKATLARKGKLQVAGVGYALPTGVDHVLSALNESSGDCLAVIQLATLELETVRHIGLPRVLSQLSRQSCVYPYPIWNDPNRLPVISKDFEASQLNGFGVHVVLQGLMPFREAGVVRLHISQSEREKLASLLNATAERNTGLLLSTTAGWSDAPACLVWNPASKVPEALSDSTSKEALARFDEPGQRLLGAFIGFAVAAKDEGAIVIEDGFMVFLAEPNRRRLVRSLTDGVPVSFHGAGAMLPVAVSFG